MTLGVTVCYYMYMKVCTSCNTNKSLSEFHRQASTKDGYRYVCKQCSSEKHVVRYTENREEFIKKAAANKPFRVARAREFILEYLLTHPCVDCGYSDIRALQFDHIVGDKVSGVGRLAAGGYSVAAIEREIAKCEVRCCNCHMIKTMERAGSWHHSRTESNNACS